MITAHVQRLTERVLRAIPEVEPEYFKELEWWGEDSPGIYNLFTFVFEPFITDSLLRDTPPARRAIKLLNDLAAEGDPAIKDVLICCVAEEWVSRPEVMQVVMPRLNDELKSIVITVRDWRPEPVNE